MPGSEVRLLVPPPENVAASDYGYTMPIAFSLRLTDYTSDRSTVRAELSVEACDVCYALVPSTMFSLHEATHTKPGPSDEEIVLDVVFELLASLIDPGDCNFDHHGGCQEHGYLGLQPGEKCPHQAAKDLLDLHGIEWR